MKLRFFNSFETVNSLYRQLLPFLVEQGHEVEALVARQRYRPGDDAGSPADRHFHRLPTWSGSDPQSRSGRLAFYASYALAAAAFSSVAPAVDCNVFLTQPPLFAAWGRALERLRGQPYVQIVMDLYPWIATAVGALDGDGSLARAAAALSTRTLQGAERVVVIGRCMAERVAALGVAPDRIVLIPNWADCDGIRPPPPGDNPLRIQLGLETKKVLLYAGNVGRVHTFDELLAVADRLRGRRDVVFVVAGSGARLPEVRLAAGRLGLDNLVLLPHQPRERLSEVLGLGDAHFVSLRTGMEGLVVPSKAYSALAAGRPLLYVGRRSGEIARMIEERDVGIVVEPGDVSGLTAAVERMLDDVDWRLRSGRRARRVGVTHRGAPSSLTAYGALLQELDRTDTARRAPGPAESPAGTAPGPAGWAARDPEGSRTSAPRR